MNNSAINAIHPTFAEILSNFSTIPQKIAKVRAVKCRVSIKTESGDSTYEGVFPSTCDAVINAQESIGMRPCKISVEVLP